MSDKAFKRELDRLEVGCLYRKTGQCPWTGVLRDYQVNSFDCVVLKNIDSHSCSLETS